MSTSSRYVLQLCHCYYDPFLDCARQYAVLFKDSPYKVITVFLSGKADPAVAQKAASDEVLFLEYSSKQLRGLKLGIIRKIRALARQYDFAAVIAHNNNGLSLIESHMGEFRSAHNFLFAERLVLVFRQIESMDLQDKCTKDYNMPHSTQ